MAPIYIYVYICICMYIYLLMRPDRSKLYTTCHVVHLVVSSITQAVFLRGLSARLMSSRRAIPLMSTLLILRSTKQYFEDEKGVK